MEHIIDNSVPPSDIFKTVLGTFSSNEITTDEGERIFCISYVRMGEQIEGKYGFFQLKKIEGILDWMVNEYVSYETPV